MFVNDEFGVQSKTNELDAFLEKVVDTNSIEMDDETWKDLQSCAEDLIKVDTFFGFVDSERWEEFFFSNK